MTKPPITRFAKKSQNVLNFRVIDKFDGEIRRGPLIGAHTVRWFTTSLAGVISRKRCTIETGSQLHVITNIYEFIYGLICAEVNDLERP